MRREFKPTLRADVARKKKAAPPEDVVVDLTLMEGESTTLHYDGSTIMDPALVSDPNGRVVVEGARRQYDLLEHIAVGLGTDDATDEDGNDRRPPGTDNSIKYDNLVGPSRAALFFDLSEIPPDAIIEEATLELEPVQYNSVLDLFNDNLPADEGGPRLNVWPVSGVVMEALNLSSFANKNATWNYAREVGDVHDPESQALRWSNIGGLPGFSTFPPNPIGMMQNSKRRDHPEPQESYDEQRIDGSVSHPDEYYGHIGYGIKGGGLIENWPLTGHETIVQDTLDTVSFDVQNQVQHGYSVNQRCNFLIRASNWGENTAENVPGDQVDIFPLTLDGVHISQVPDGPPVEMVLDDDTIHAVPQNLTNATSVTYEWYQESPITIPPLANDWFLSRDTTPVKEGETVRATVTVNGDEAGGVPETNQFTFNWYTTPPGESYPEGRVLRQTTTVSQSSFMVNSFTIPTTVGGHNLRCEVVLDNPTDLPGESVSQIENFFTIGFDLDGTLEVDVTTGPGDVNCNFGTPCGEVENGSQLQVTCSVTGVQNPTFDYILGIIFPDGTTDVVSLTEDSTSVQSPLYTLSLPDQVGNGVYTLVVNLKEGGQGIQTDLKAWTYTVEEDAPALPWVQQPEYRSGVYRLKASSEVRCRTQPNRRNPDFLPGEFGCAAPNTGFQSLPDMKITLDVIEPSNCTGDGSFSGRPYITTSGASTTKEIFAFLDRGQGGAIPQGVDANLIPFFSYNGSFPPISAVSRYGFGGKFIDSGSGCSQQSRPTDLATWSENGGWRYFVSYPYLLAGDVDGDPCNQEVIRALNDGENADRGDPAIDGFSSFGDFVYRNTDTNVPYRSLSGCTPPQNAPFPRPLGLNMLTGWIQVAGPELPTGGPDSLNQFSNPDLGDTWFFHFRDGWSAGMGSCGGGFEPADLDTSLHYPDGIPVPTDELLASWPAPTDADFFTGGTPPPTELPEIPEANPLLWNPNPTMELTYPSHILIAKLGSDPHLAEGEARCNEIPIGNTEVELKRNQSLFGYMILGEDFSHEGSPSNTGYNGPLAFGSNVCNGYSSLCVEPDQDSPDNPGYMDDSGNPIAGPNVAMSKWYNGVDGDPTLPGHTDYKYIVEVWRPNPTTGERNLHGILCSTNDKAFYPDMLVGGDPNNYGRSLYFNTFLAAGTEANPSSSFYKEDDEIVVYLFDTTEDLENAIAQAKVKVVGAFPGINANGSNLKVFNANNSIADDIGIPS